MKTCKLLGACLAMVLASTPLVGCGSNSDSAESMGKPDSILVWDYGEPASGQDRGWHRAAEIFTKKTGIKVKFEVKSFTQIAQNGSQFLNSDQAPDVMKSNRGNGSAGVLSTQNLLTDLKPYVKKYGWDKKVTGQAAAVGKYDKRGVMDGDTWYGIPSYAEMQRVYYNKDIFAKYGLQIPKTYGEFTQVLQAFKDKGVTPITADAGEFGVLWLWWQLAMTKADRKFVDDWQLYKHKVNWRGEPLTFATDTIKDWFDKGYISRNATGMKAEDTTTAFIRGEYPIYQTGSWNQNRFMEQIKNFEWTAAIFPDSKMVEGCAGNLLVIPEKAKHKDLAAQYIDIVLSDEIQNFIGNHGGVPVHADSNAITDTKSRELVQEYNDAAKANRMSYYPDYPAPNLTDAMPAAFQELVNGTKKPSEVLQTLQKDYDDGVSQMGLDDN